MDGLHRTLGITHRTFWRWAMVELESDNWSASSQRNEVRSNPNRHFHHYLASRKTRGVIHRDRLVGRLFQSLSIKKHLTAVSKLGESLLPKIGLQRRPPCRLGAEPLLKLFRSQFVSAIQRQEPIGGN